MLAHIALTHRRKPCYRATEMNYLRDLMRSEKKREAERKKKERWGVYHWNILGIYGDEDRVKGTKIYASEKVAARVAAKLEAVHRRAFAHESK